MENQTFKANLVEQNSLIIEHQDKKIVLDEKSFNRIFQLQNKDNERASELVDAMVGAGDLLYSTRLNTNDQAKHLILDETFCYIQEIKRVLNDLFQYEFTDLEK